MIQYKCDGCGKLTHINPPSEPVLDESGKPKMIHREIPSSGGEKPHVMRSPEVRYLEEKSYIVSLKIGDVKIQRDFCEECLIKIKPKLKEVMDMLKEIKPQ